MAAARGRRLGVLLTASAMLLALVSCLSIESRFSFDADGSGELRLEYRLDPVLAQLGNAAQSGALPLPITEADFRAATAAVDGLELTGYRRDEVQEAVEVSATLRFDRVERLAELRSFSALQPRLEGSDPVTFELVIGADDRAGPALEGDTLELLAVLFGDHAVSFVVETPRPIRDSSGGTITKDGRQVAISIPLATYAAQEVGEVLTVRW